MAQLIANRGAAYRDHGPKSVGGPRLFGPIPGAWVMAIGQAGEVFPVTANDLGYKDFQGQGTFVQASAGVSIRYSMSPIAQSGSLDPIVRDGAVWTAPQTIPANSIEETDAKLWVSAEITFTAAGSVAFMAR